MAGIEDLTNRGVEFAEDFRDTGLERIIRGYMQAFRISRAEAIDMIQREEELPRKFPGARNMPEWFEPSPSPEFPPKPNLDLAACAS